MRTARPITSWDYLVAFFMVMAPSSQRLEPPGKSGRFTLPLAAFGVRGAAARALWICAPIGGTVASLVGREGCEMKVFLSWSGQRSHEIAKAFAGWLPTVLFGARPWISSSDIDKGSTWISSIKEALHESNGLGIFFLTKEAINSNWLLFEAGSIASLGHQRVCIVYVDIEANEVGAPLSLFQGTKLAKEDVHQLLRSLNKALQGAMDEAVLATTFERGWPDLEAVLKDKLSTSERGAGKRTKRPTADQVLADLAESTQRIEARISNLERQFSRDPGSLWTTSGLLSPTANNMLAQQIARARSQVASIVVAKREEVFSRAEPLNFQESLLDLTPTQRTQLCAELGYDSIEAMTRAQNRWWYSRHHDDDSGVPPQPNDDPVA